jgi:hypothetical protein
MCGGGRKYMNCHWWGIKMLYYKAALCTVCFMRHRWHSSLLIIHSFRAADCDTDHCPMVVKVRERLAVSKQEGQKFDVERLNLRRQHGLEVRK